MATTLDASAAALSLNPAPAVHKACNNYQPHAFLSIDRCRDCGFNCAQHHMTEEQKEDPSTTKGYNQDAVRELIYNSRQNCSTFTGHYWIWNRCRDCARSEGIHEHSNGQQPHLTNPYLTWIEYKGLEKTAENCPITTIVEGHQRIQQNEQELAATEEDYERLKQMQTDQYAAKKLTTEEYQLRLHTLQEVNTKRTEDLKHDITVLQQQLQALLDAEAEKKRKEEELQLAADVVVDGQHVKVDEEQKEEAAAVVDTTAEDEAARLAREQEQAELERQHWEQMPENEWHIKIGDLTIQQHAQKKSFAPRVERLMQNGRNFVRFTSSQPKPTMVSLFLRQLNGDAHSALYWSTINDRSAHATRRIGLEEINAIVLGKQSSTHQVQCGAEVNAKLCFSILSANGQSLHLQAGTQRERDLWAYGLQRLIAHQLQQTEEQLIPLVQEGCYEEPKERVTAERKYEKLEVNDQVTGVTDNTLQQLQRIDASKQYELVYNVQGTHFNGKHNNYIVCLIGRSLQTDQPEYLGQTDRTGVDMTFSTPLKLQYEWNPRSGEGLHLKYRLNVYDLPMHADTIEDEFRIGSAVLTSEQLKMEVGKSVTLTMEHKDPTKNAHLQASHSTVVLTLASRNEVVTHQPKFQWPPQVIAQYMDRLVVGSNVELYSSPDKCHEVELYYVVNRQLDASRIPDVGTLYYVPQGHARVDERKWSLPVSRVTDVYRGRRSEAFPETIADELCLSLVIDNGKRLDIVCADKETRDLWVGGVVNVLLAAKSYKKRLPL